MAGNITLTNDSGTVLASDEVDGAQVLRVKPQFGGDGTASDVSTNNPLPVALPPTLSVFRTVALVASPQIVAGGATGLYGWHLANTGSAAAFVKVYDNATPTIGTDNPVMTLVVPAGGVVASDQPNGIAFTNGIAVAATTGASDTDTGAPASGTVIVNLFHR